MPIRFRCAYCNQLLGITRRKAGTVVRCPGCSGQVVVPSLEEAGMADKNTAAAGGGPGVFEGNEIDKVLEEADQPSMIHGPGPAAPSKPAAAPPPRHSGPAPAFHPPTPPRGAGILLSPAKATILSVILVVAIAFAFGMGLVLGLVLGK